MDRDLNLKLEKDTIYEIYRGCRLCGAGAGYKMPIVQNVVDLEESGVKLSQKIRECVQIEVHQDDKMPPLICELCVDKVNDFYEFLVMCHQTNKQTRLKLGLPLQTSSGSEYESGNCLILGMSETIYVDDDSDVEPLSRQMNKPRPKDRHKEESLRREQRSKNIKEVKVNNKDTSNSGRLTRTSNSNSQQDKMPSHIVKNNSAPLRVTRTSGSVTLRDRPSSSIEDDPVPVRVTRTASGLLQQQQYKNSTAFQNSSHNTKTGGKPKSILKKEKDNEVIKIEDETSFFESRKRSMGYEVKPAVPSKKVRILSDHSKQPSKVTPRKTKPPESQQRSSKSSTSQRSQRPAPGLPGPPTDTACDVICPICYQQSRTLKGHNNHVRVHVANYTNIKLACNPCGEWFLNASDVDSHHRQHKFKGLPYRCRRCSAEFKQINLYNNHLTNGDCIPYDVVPDVMCEVCWRYFATDNLLIQHKCTGEDGRPGGKCNKCNRTYVLLKNLKRHESICMHKKKSEPIVEPGVMESLKTMEIRLVRCDYLLTDKHREFLNASHVTQNYGLNDSCVYPYISSVRSLKIKEEPLDDDFDCMVDINDKVNEFLTEEDCVDWDSGNDDNDGETSVSAANRRQRVDTLAALALKAVVSQRFLGKVPKKYRKIRVEKMIDSLGEFGVKNVDKLLERLDDDVDNSVVTEEHEASDVNNEDSVIDKSVSVIGDANSVSDVAREDRRSSVGNDSDRESHGSENAGHFSKDGDESSKKMNVNNEERDDKRMEMETREERVNDILQNSNNSVQDLIERNDSTVTNKSSDSNLCKDVNDSVTNEDIIPELNGHKPSSPDNRDADETSSDNLEHKNGDLHKNFAINNVLNTDFEDKKLMDALDEEIGENIYTEGDGKSLNSMEKHKDSSTEMFAVNIGSEELDPTANGQNDSEQKITLEDILVNKDVDHSSSYLDTISEDEYNFDV